jgi:hypothetical protein
MERPAPPGPPTSVPFGCWGCLIPFTTVLELDQEARGWEQAFCLH